MPVLVGDADELPVVPVLLLELLLAEELHAARADPARPVTSRAARTTASCLRAVRIPELLIRFMLLPRCFGNGWIAPTGDGAGAAPTVVCARIAASPAWCPAIVRPGGCREGPR